MPDRGFRLRFPEADIETWASRYSYRGEMELISGPVERARKQGYLDMETFLAIGEWKSPRVRKRRAANSPEFVEEISRLALLPSTSPRLAIESLTLLSGVDWPTASVILHFCHNDPYPILDFRALWSISAPAGKYDHSLWEDYTAYTRALADRAKVSMRTLDRALWKYSEVHQ